MASPSCTRAQLVSARIAATLVLGFVILVSQTAAESKSGHGGNSRLNTSSSYISTIARFRRDVQTTIRTVEGGFIKHTPGVGTHKIHTSKKTWHQARKICQDEGSQLAVVNSLAEAKAIKELIVESGNEWQAFIGFNDIDAEGQYVTVDGRTLKEAGFDVWSGGQPSRIYNNVAEDCGTMCKYGRLNDVYCDSLYPFVCELPILDWESFLRNTSSSSLNNTIFHSRRSVIHEAMQFDLSGITGINAVYELYYEAKTWKDARKICQANDGHLAIINSIAESQLIAYKIKPYKGNHRDSANSDFVLVGYNNEFDNKLFRTIDGRTPVEAGFAEWSPGEPNNGGNTGEDENCGALYREKLNDVHCNKKYAFLCEIPPLNNVLPAGPAGPAGPRGIRGDKGVSGSAGVKGETGSRGPPGSRGLTGPPGPKGVQGAHGMKGEAGSSGAAGLDGRKGEPGGRGKDGLRGVPGEKGEMGDSGRPGPRGLIGLPGQAGNRGPSGSAGPKGDFGPLGPQGPKGEPGPPGPAGSRCEPDNGWLAVLQTLEQNHAYGLIDGGEAPSVSGNTKSHGIFKEFVAKACEQMSARAPIQDSVQPDGGMESPAKTCKHLFLAYPDKPSGEYWIDPNGDDISDAILVHCDAEKRATCVEPESPRTSNISSTGSEIEVWLSEIDDKLQITYTAGAEQVTALQVLSRHAEQTVTYHCIKSVAYFDTENQYTERGLKLLAWNDVELGPRGSRHFRYDVISDGCKDRLDEWNKTVITYRTNQPARLPVLDVGLRDVGKPGQSFAVEIGKVCFS